MSSPASPVESGPVEYDPVFLHSRKEALVIFGLWGVALLWAVPYCYLQGYVQDSGGDPEQLAILWGMPRWVVWGIVVPWLVADLFTTWFCFFYMADDDLGEAADVNEAPKTTGGDA